MKQQSGMAMVALAALAAVLILVFGYLFGVSPQLSAAGIANEEHALAIQDNLSIEEQTRQLQALALEVPGWEADSEALSDQVPSLPDTEHLHRMLIDAATAAGIPWVEFRIEDIFVVSATTQEPVAPPATTPEDDATTEDESPTEPSPAPTAPAEPAAPAAPAAAAPVEGLVAIKFVVKTEGHPPAVKQFLTNVYQQTNRWVTLQGVLIEGSDGADAAPGRPGLVRGDITITMTGVAFVLIDPANPLAIDETGGVPVPALPSPAPSPSPSASPSPSPSVSD